MMGAFELVLGFFLVFFALKVKVATYNILIVRTAMFCSIGIAYSAEWIDLSTETIAELSLAMISGLLVGATVCLFMRKS